MPFNATAERIVGENAGPAVRDRRHSSKMVQKPGEDSNFARLSHSKSLFGLNPTKKNRRWPQLPRFIEENQFMAQNTNGLNREQTAKPSAGGDTSRHAGKDPKNQSSPSSGLA